MKFYGLIIIIIVFLSACDGYNKLLKSSDYDLKFTKANEYFIKKDYFKAQNLYEELIPIFKGTEKLETVYYRFALCHYYNEDYNLAQYHFKNFYNNHPNSNNAENSLFLNAYCFYLNSPEQTLDQTDTESAISEFQDFLDIYPESLKIDTCNVIIDQLRGKIEQKSYDIATLFYKIEDYKAAINSLQNFFKDFPNSNLLDEALFYTIDSYYSLALISHEIKKKERLELSTENYLKFVDLYPDSKFRKKADKIYLDCLTQISKT